MDIFLKGVALKLITGFLGLLSLSQTYTPKIISPLVEPQSPLYKEQGLEETGKTDLKAQPSPRTTPKSKPIGDSPITSSSTASPRALPTVQSKKTPETGEGQELRMIFNDANESTTRAIVNLVCKLKIKDGFVSITGTGVIIDPRGIILTNAHLGQYFLLEDYLTDSDLSCDVRTGSPATPRYKARLIFIAPQWVKDNYQDIGKSNPRGTGENDYAFLIITETTNASTPLPKIFQYLEENTNESQIQTGKNVLIAGYPNQLFGNTFLKNLSLVTAVTQIEEIFSFKGTARDLISVGGSLVAAQGSSGGPVVNEVAKLIGIAVTSEQGATIDESDLRAISLAHISRSLEESTNLPLESFLGRSLETIENELTKIYGKNLGEIIFYQFNINNR